VQVIDVPAIGPAGKAIRPAARDQAVEERTDVLGVPHAREGRVLAPQAVAAVQGDGREEPGLSHGEPERFEGLGAFGERPHRRSR
jgi:hypothetical protein